MMMIGVDYHRSFQTIAFGGEDSGEYDERELSHSTLHDLSCKIALQCTGRQIL